MEPILKAGWLEELPDLEKQGGAWMEVIAALCPPAQRGALRSRVATFDSTVTTNALPLLDILDAMENIRAHA